MQILDSCGTIPCYSITQVARWNLGSWYDVGAANSATNQLEKCASVYVPITTDPEKVWSIRSTFKKKKMVARGLAGAATLALALASVGAFAPGTAFVRNPLSPSSYGIDKIVSAEGEIVTSSKVRI